jgi:hypothetical protein
VRFGRVFGVGNVRGGGGRGFLTLFFVVLSVLRVRVEVQPAFGHSPPFAPLCVYCVAPLEQACGPRPPAHAHPVRPPAPALRSQRRALVRARSFVYSLVRSCVRPFVRSCDNGSGMGGLNRVHVRWLSMCVDVNDAYINGPLLSPDTTGRAPRTTSSELGQEEEEKREERGDGAAQQQQQQEQQQQEQQ